MASKKKVVEMETHHFVVLGTLTMYTFIDFVAVLSNSILRLYPQNFDKINDGVCKKTQQEDTTDPVWAGVGIAILTLPGVFLITQTDGPLNDGLNMAKKIKDTTNVKYVFKIVGYAIGILFYPAMLLTTQLIAIWQNDIRWFNVSMLMAGLHALFNSFPHLIFELYMLLNCGERHISQYVLICMAFIFMVSNAIRFDLIANRIRFHSFKEKLFYGLMVLPQHTSCILFRVMSFVLTFTFIRWYALLPTILYFLEIMILAGYTVAAEWNIVYNVGMANISMMNIGFVKFLSDKTKFPNDLNQRMKNFVRLSSVVTFLHHSIILALLLILEYHGYESAETSGLNWKQIILWKTKRNNETTEKDQDPLSFYLTFNNVIAVGLVNLCLSLYASKDIEVGDEEEEESLVVTDGSSQSNMRPRATTSDQEEIWRLSHKSKPGSSKSTQNRQSQIIPPSRTTPSPKQPNRNTSDSEEDEEHLELV